MLFIERTCPCEENMPMWHSSKLNKYSSLVSLISKNNWNVDLFAVEVGARGYCASSLTQCLKRLGYPNKLAFSTAKCLSRLSMEASFCIWVARESKAWCQDHQLTSARPNSISHGNFSHRERNAKEKAMTSPKVCREARSSKRVGFCNKGNTCYANAILQALSVCDSLWRQRPSESSLLSPMAKAFSLNMAMLHRSAGAIDPLHFLKALSKVIAEKRQAPFVYNSQQDASEVLQYVIDELKDVSAAAHNSVATVMRVSVTCDTCFSVQTEEVAHDILLVPRSCSVSTSVRLLLQQESLSGETSRFCRTCQDRTPCTIDSSVTQCGSILIVRMNRVIHDESGLSKDTRVVDSAVRNPLSVPISAEEGVSFTAEYRLVSTINHSGSADKGGHYWAYVFCRNTKSWLMCNDTSVTVASPADLNNGSSCLFFFVRAV